MIDFEWPWLFLLLPVPWLVRHYFKPAKPTQDTALQVPFLEDFGHQAITGSSLKWPIWIAIIAWCLLLIASARPQWLGEAKELPVSGRDMMLAVDLSGSMEEQDFRLQAKWVDRLTATKSVASDFIERRVSDRIGLILFGQQAYLQTPLTFDRKTVIALLNEAVIGLAGQSTAIGDALGLAVKRLRKRKEGNRVLILLTDGANTAGEVDPLKAAELAAKEGLKIYTIGIGADEILIRDFFGTRRVNPSTELDEATLKKIADMTNGHYFRARDTQEFEKIYRLLDELEPIEQEAQHFRPRTSLYPWPLGLALVLTTILLVTRKRNSSVSRHE